MAQPYVGEIRIFAGNFAPAGWSFCDGQLLAISENETLFNLIGTTYGGDGQSTFALPDLRGRIPLHFGNGFIQAETGGAETVTLTVSQIPAHSHPWQATSAGATNSSPVSNALATSTAATYSNLVPASPMASHSVAFTGGNQPHNNFQPYICINYIISLYGIYPSPT
ncbi:MAG: phage tail protein [Planctomycetes bacterium]|nr:phage tail protein [Planctomycetota bacterium]